MWSRRLVKSESSVQAASDLHDLRHALKDSLTNVGILSAFLCTLGCSAYVEPPNEALCFGDTAMKIAGAILWVAMAPHSSPLFLTYAGTFLLATGYGIDLNERVGCPMFPFGIFAAPCFPVAVLGFGIYMRRRRRLLVKKYGSSVGEESWDLGVSFFLPWHDLILEIEGRPKSNRSYSEQSSSVGSNGRL
ncbi:hypothetical protein TrST_g1473 [Triparma strigata]|uniref:Uncharacterized protein n=1 Tax=Triparma strigata TaxID=1606541 RepID=A0A9W7AJ97_9STRA|nr:hypothetical protein TrST_g1473 [Triparma strigata]